MAKYSGTLDTDKRFIVVGFGTKLDGRWRVFDRKAECSVFDGESGTRIYNTYQEASDMAAHYEQFPHEAN